MAIAETYEQALARYEELEALQEEYKSFGVFLDDVMAHIGFRVSPLQHDIGKFLEFGPKYIMVQAQRGQAKTTITAAFAVWSLIHDPKHRVLILSAGGRQANEISTLIVRLIMTMDGLECLRPDPTMGDRTSVEAFDVHYTLKGVDKSPSVACVGITGNLQGKRADLLIPDDIESTKNSSTAIMREILLNLTRDFTSICTTGRIIYLGTPQTQDSIYNTLPSRGFTIRIWPGRYPTPEQMDNYGEMLAPTIRQALTMNPALAFGGGMLKDQGQPTDPTYITEEILQGKELDQGPTYFQLQHMLNTKLADALRYPLKPELLIRMRLGRTEYFPLMVARDLSEASLTPHSVHSFTFKLASPAQTDSKDVAKLTGKVMYVDPAGGGKNGDETGYAVTGFLNSNIYWLAGGGVPGGYANGVMQQLAEIAKRWDVQKVIIEKNMGYGGFAQVFIPILRAAHPNCAVEEDYVTGQKELRIIETLEPVMARGSLIVNDDVLEEDADCCQKHSLADRILYSVFHQMAKITRDKQCLVHDDRLDALEGAVRYWTNLLAVDQDAAIKAARAREWAEAHRDPMQHRRHEAPSKRGGSLFNKYMRK
ncbi:terminase large subunit [Caulobacter phage Lullwater]|uniref:Large terminase n=1 Tax=Caulobacter phage Lullwater TaxID=2024607 RepID=A0A291LB47_9CAUD|nr:terminase large subunit [Caulobacter phage Lullwater]ATI16352.1 large terminase [Caulobacter phage Lullwater]